MGQDIVIISSCRNFIVVSYGDTINIRNFVLADEEFRNSHDDDVRARPQQLKGNVFSHLIEVKTYVKGTVLARDKKLS